MKNNLLWRLFTTTPVNAWRYVWHRVLLYKALFLHSHTPLHVKVLMVVAVLYLLMPLDIIPDTIPLLGITDDMAVIWLISSYAEGFISDELREEVLGRK